MLFERKKKVSMNIIWFWVLGLYFVETYSVIWTIYVHVYSEPPKKSWKNYGFKVHKKAAKVIKLLTKEGSECLLI